MTKKTKEKPEGYVFGRPTKYRKEYCQKIIEYFDRPLYEVRLEQKMSASGQVKEVEVREPADIPTFEGFAVRELRVNPDTLVEWTKKHTEFSVAYNTCKGIQAQFIHVHSLKGGYSANFAKFFAVNNLGMKDKTEVSSENTHDVKGYGLAFDLSEKPE